MFASMWAQLHVGPDLCPDTDYEGVPACFDPHHVPVYTLEVKREGEWAFYSALRHEDVEFAVETMHYDFDMPVRLMEDGHSVFACWRF